MTPREQAESMVDRMNVGLMNKNESIACAKIAVQYIINANPHSNPLNTEVISTMDYWQEVLTELNKM